MVTEISWGGKGRYHFGMLSAGGSILSVMISC